MQGIWLWLHEVPIQDQRKPKGVHASIPPAPVLQGWWDPTNQGRVWKDRYLAVNAAILEKAILHFAIVYSQQMMLDIG